MPIMYKGYAARIDYSDDDGCLMLRLLPEVHARAAMMAAAHR